MRLITVILLLFVALSSTAQDTTYNTFNVQHDSAVTTTIPEQIIERDSTFTVIDTVFNAYYDYQLYAEVEGTTQITVTLFDTIAAHDTTFMCSLCASHDTTVMIISTHPVTIRANNQNKALGSTFTFANNGTQLSITGGSLKVGDVITADNSSSTGASSGAASGTYAINTSLVTILRGATDVTSTYLINYQPGTLTVAGAIPITIRADDQSKIYGQAFTFTHDATQVDLVSGILDAGDVITVDNASSTGSTANSNAGTYTISFNSVTIMDGATNVTGNYAITYQTGTLTVNTAPITIKANDQGKTAGQTFTFTGNGSQVSVTSGTLISGDAITGDNATSSGSGSGAAAGAYAITLSSALITNGATNVTSNYSITYVAGTLTVAAAPLIITIAPKPQTKVYGSTFTFLGNGTQVQVTSGSLQSGDVITVDNAASTGSGATANAGSYSITLSAVTIMNGATNVTGNYTITYQTNTLTVTTKPITVRANNQTKAWGSTFTFLGNGSQVAITSGSLVSGHTITADNAASTGSGSGANAGSYTVTLSSVTITSGVTNVTSNYNIIYQTGSLTVTARAITVKANNQSKVQGTTFTFTHDGTQVSVVSGSLLSGNVITVDNAASTGSGSGVLTGAYPITLSSVTIMSGATNVTSNYFITYQGGTLSVNAGTDPGIRYGIFVLNADPYGTLPLRINHAKYVGVPVFRYNYDFNVEQYRLQDILDEDLEVALTWNHKRVRTNANWPTGAEIPFYAAKLDSMLKLPGGKPELLSINNEEGHREYWPGTVQGYLTWFEACVNVAHDNNVPISNGGITSGIVYRLWQWYKDRNLPDSVAWLSNIWGIAGGNGTYVQEQIQWYTTLLNGFAASNMDYVNLHWYEPERDNFSKLTTSKVLPKVVHMLRVLTGKPVLTTEIGTKNEHCPLLYEMMEEAKAADMRWIIYFAGESNERATDLSDCYKAWLAQ